ncbi:MAG: branched-chain amino acid ABC transporter permease [Rhodospirillaceae bacterium]|jgi:branched-chain amino acid transport system permease protein|nr:branched-chain amino acid ABC transporter permease [Rhodospirillaceae bacterium]MBT5014288.1 branched-chain amino acid ABC transporter permease [Rhodospirillaceae bacterium]MBT5308305.1 branched-chain amino acid ABC transporter permease [Rhodospirillaceae bacterium]MBT7356976.1 branched-chain amino acid ABC transporter permease [Rhodospirillaceae bacterium]
MSPLNMPGRNGLLALIATIMVLPLMLPNAFYFDIVILIGLNSIVCIGLNLLIGYAGQISLGHAGFFGIGAYFSAILTSTYGWPATAAMVVGAVVVGLLSFIIARPIMKLQGHYLAMGTLGLGVIITIVLTQESDLTGGPDGMPVPGFSIFGWEPYGETVWYWIIAAVLVATVWLSLNLIASPVGRALRAVHGSEIAAETLGVNVVKYKVLVFVLSAIIASLAGSLFAHYTGFITPDTSGFIHSIQLVTMVVLGGMASTFGAVAGAAILTILPQLLTVFHDYEHLVFGAVLIGTMIFMRRGLVPTLADLFNGRQK